MPNWGLSRYIETKPQTNNRIVDHLENCGCFSDFQYGFRSSRSTADLLTVVSYRIARVFNRSGATRAVALDISEAFDRVWHAGLLHKLKSYGISGQIFGLISSFLNNRRLGVVLDGKSSQEYPVNAGVLQGSILGPALFCSILMTFLMMLSVILLSMLMILLFTLTLIRHLICSNNFNWLLDLNLIYKTLWTQVRSGLLISMLGKLSWFRLTSLITIVLLMWKWMGLFLRKTHLLRCWGWGYFLNLIGVLTLSLLLILPPRKLKL